MRIRSISINNWRNFKDVSLQLDDPAPLVCIVGANGTGKTHMLELIAACAHRLGLSKGIEIPRGDPFADKHEFTLQFHLAPGVSDAVDSGLSADANYELWDRTLVIESSNLSGSPVLKIKAGGVAPEDASTNFARTIVNALKSSKDVNFLSLDSDRAYPKRNINVNELAQAYDIDWEATEYTRGRSFKTTATLYDEWIKYFLAQENQSGTRLMQDTRRAKKYGTEVPLFEDPFEGFAESLLKVLPHVVFTGVDPKRRTLLFDTAGLELAFSQLSGGEREIAFLVGQIDRFRLREGLFLIDEPELHLNADLIRTWVTYLTGTISVGQIWLATHSLEAVEAAGQKATFILERNEETKKVDRAARLDTRPILTALSRAVGTPAFSISQLRFVFIEGEANIGERERYRKLTNVSQDVRFIECGSCREVIRRVSAVKSLSLASTTEIRLGGVVDRDFRSAPESEKLRSDFGVFVLPVHEVENFFLHPATMNSLLEQNGVTDAEATGLIQEIADKRAGSWIFQYVMATKNAKALGEVSSAAKEHAKSMSWVAIEADHSAAAKSISEKSGLEESERSTFETILNVGIEAYKRVRVERDLWAVCEGKQVLQDIARRCGFADGPAMELAAFACWGSSGVEVPGELDLLRRYVVGL